MESLVGPGGGGEHCGHVGKEVLWEFGGFWAGGFGVSHQISPIVRK